MFMTETPQPNERSSLAKGLDVLAAVVDAGPQRASELAARTGIPISSLYRFTQALVAAGFLESTNSIYRIGPRLSRSTEELNAFGRLRDRGLLVLRWLVDQTGETALLTVRAGDNALVVEAVDSFHTMRMSFERGHLRPLYAGASAKVLLAFGSPGPMLDRILAGGLERYTSKTPTKRMLPKQLADIRSRRYSITMGEVDAHAVGVGVPVFVAGELICALSLAGPEFRYGPQVLPKLLLALQEAASRLEVAMALSNTALESP